MLPRILLGVQACRLLRPLGSDTGKAKKTMHLLWDRLFGIKLLPLAPHPSGGNSKDFPLNPRRLCGILSKCSGDAPPLRHFFARTAWSQRRIQIFFLAKNCAKFVHAHSRKPCPNLLRELCRCAPAEISHNLGTFSDAPAHLSHKFPGTCRDCLAHKFCTIFSGTWPVLKICLCTGNECLISTQPRS